MTHENSEGASHVGDRDQAEPPVAERASVSDEITDPMIQIDVEPPLPAVPVLAAPAVLAAPVLEVRARDAGDSVPPVSRKLAPPPKPRRDSGAASRPPSARPGEMPDPLTSSALKAPIAPSLSYSSFPAVNDIASDGAADAVLPSAPGSMPPLSPPPPRWLSSLAISEDAETASSASVRPASEPALGSVPPKSVAAPPRPTPLAPQPPRPRTEPPATLPVASESASPAASARAPSSIAPSSIASSSSSSSSSIFAMRIIAVGDPTRTVPAQAESAGDIDPNAYPPSASRLGTGVRRSSRPKIAAVLAPEVLTDTPPVVADVPVVAAAPGMTPHTIEVAAPEAALPTIEVAAPEAALPTIEVAAPEAFSVAAVHGAPGNVAPPRSSALAVAAPHDEGAEELSDEDVSPDSNAKHAATTDAEELDRDEAISMPPEELAAFQAEAKTDPGKPPPPPKRAAFAPPAAGPPEAPRASVAPSASATPPTPDLAAAKAAQRKNTRAPWWEDLFSEDFMRAQSRVSDEQIRREVTFIEESLGVAAGGVVLDLGCGAGHHAVEFASRGYGVVGYDLSLYQLALAADVAQERSQKINFLQGDMREMAFEEMFDGVFCWNTTFGYFEEDKNLAVAQRVFKALRPGGMFLIDVLNRDFAAASAPCTVWYEGDSCVCMDDMSVDYISSRLRVKRSIILDDGRTKESLYSLRLYSLHELGKLLHEVGFRVTEASGHPATPGVFFGPNSPRIIMLAQRP